jgi:hypothetical protein
MQQTDTIFELNNSNNSLRDLDDFHVCTYNDVAQLSRERTCTSSDSADNEVSTMSHQTLNDPRSNEEQLVQLHATMKAIEQMKADNKALQQQYQCLGGSINTKPLLKENAPCEGETNNDCVSEMTDATPYHPTRTIVAQQLSVADQLLGRMQALERALTEVYHENRDLKFQLQAHKQETILLRERVAIVEFAAKVRSTVQV